MPYTPSELTARIIRPPLLTLASSIIVWYGPKVFPASCIAGMSIAPPNGIIEMEISAMKTARNGDSR